MLSQRFTLVRRHPWRASIAVAEVHRSARSGGGSNAARACLTLRSRRQPTASHQARVAALLIICHTGLAPCRRLRLNSNVRPHSHQPCNPSTRSSLRSRPSALSFRGLEVPDFEQHPSVEAIVEIPIQPGLSLRIQLNLQNRDELHLVASNLWVEWFPCKDRGKVKLFVDAVAGLLVASWRLRKRFSLGSQ